MHARRQRRGIPYLQLSKGAWGWTPRHTLKELTQHSRTQSLAPFLSHRLETTHPPRLYKPTTAIVPERIPLVGFTQPRPI
eukprot:399516-Rhodomonas_salina.1